jgi:hypothetical protein
MVEKAAPALKASSKALDPKNVGGLAVSSLRIISKHVN